MTCTKEINSKMHFSLRLQGWQTFVDIIYILIQMRIFFYYSINLLESHYDSCDQTDNLLDMKHDSHG